MIKAVAYTLSYFNKHDVDPMGHLRLVAPLEKANIPIILGFDGDQIFPERVTDGDIVIIQRQFPVKFKQYKEIIRRAHEQNKPVIFETDDLLFFLPEDHPDRIEHIYTPALLPIYQAILEADVITVPTNKLREVLMPYNENIIVLPNYFDDNLWQLRKPNVKEDKDEIIKIGYMGTNSHKPDIEYLLPVILEVLHRYSQKVRFHFWGLKPPDILQSFSQVEWTPWYSYSYKEFASFFQTQIADIFIAPLMDNLFNRCKSPLKYFEYSALGVPGIYSDIEPYREIVENGKNGFLANSLKDWSDYLNDLIEQPSLRHDIAMNAQSMIKENWLLSQNAHLWRDVYHDAIETKRNGNIRKQIDFSFINSINLQMSELMGEKDKYISSLKTQVHEQQALIDSLKKLVNDYEQEIISYVMSRSWRYTRLFRKINRKVHGLWEK